MYDIRLGRIGLALLIAATLPRPLSPFGVEEARAADEERRVLSARDATLEEEQTEEYRRLAREKRLESIARLKDLLSSGVDGDRKAEMMLRLADLYFQEGRALHMEEMERYEDAFDACFNDQNCDTSRMAPNNTESNSWHSKSIKLYEAILSSYPRYDRADQATYFLGLAYEEVGDRENALEAYKKLVKLYPQSQYVPDGYVLIGEYYFDNNNAYAALRAFLRATSYQDSERYPFAMYKLGWCYYNVGEYGKGIDTMKQVVAFADANSTAANRLQLQDEALRDLVRFFADAGAMEEAYAYFTQLGKKDLIQSMLIRLATTYFEQGKFEESIETYKRLILEDPQSAKNPGYQEEIIKAYRKMGQKDRILEEIDRLRRDYGASSSWARANSANQDALADASSAIERTLRRTAVDYHEEARTLAKSRHPRAGEMYEFAYRAYKVYLEEFPSSPEGYDVRYAFGELLYKTKRYDEAYEQYMAVVDIDPNGQHSRFCAESAIFAADEMVKQEGGGSAPQIRPGEAADPQPLTEWEQRLVGACAKYAQLYPNDQKVRNIIYKSAYLLYNKYRFEEAAEQFRAVIKMDPASREAEQAAHLILDSFKIHEDWNNLKLNARFFFDQEGLGSSKFKQEVYDIYQRASFKVIETRFAAEHDNLWAAEQFVAFYEEFPDSDVAAQALNNASVYFHASNRVGDAMRVRHILIDDPKFGDKTKYFYDQLAALGYDYERIADFASASDYYERMFELYPERRKALEASTDADKDERLSALTSKAADAIYSAAVFRNALGDWQTAVADYQKFIETFPQDERSTESKLTIGRVYEEQERWADAANTFFAFYSKAPADTPIEFTYFARLHYGKALIAQDQITKARKVYEETVELYERQHASLAAGAHTEIVAEMMFQLIQPKFDEYMALTIRGAGAGASRRAEDKSIGDSLTRKTQALLKIQEGYTKIIQTGAGEWGLASLLMLGRAYENMGQTLHDATPPNYLTPDQIELYRMAIEDKVYTQTEKAVDAYQRVLQKSFELTLYNENTAYATRRLGELRPEDFPGLEETLLPAGYRTRTVRVFDVETDLN